MFEDICVNKIKVSGHLDAVQSDEFTLLGNCGTLHNYCIAIWTFTDDKHIYNNHPYNIIQ